MISPNCAHEKKTIDWAKFAFEGTVIVVSILLAFWIDATWESHQQRIEGRQLATALTRDVATTHEHIESLVERSARANRLAREILESIADPEQAENLHALLLDTGSVFIYHPWHPTTDTYDQAIGSGDLSLIDDFELRSALAAYASALVNVGHFVESSKLQYFDQQEPFLVKNTIYSEIAMATYKSDLVEAPFVTDTEALANSTEFWNLLTFKLELEEAVLASLDRAAAASDGVQKLLAQYVDGQ